MLSDGLEITSYATHMQQVCNKYINDMYRTFFSRNTGECPFLLLPLIEEFANCVEHKKDIEAGNSFRGLLNALGQFLRAFKELIVDGVCWFPRLMRWKTSKGEVAPVFSDYKNEGYDYRLKAYMNAVTKEKYSIDSIQEEIKPENRIGTLEQLEQGIVAAEEMVREMERTRIRER